MQKHFLSLTIAILLTFTSLSVQAQFAVPEFEKVTEDRRAWFMNKFADIKWTGRGLYGDTEIDDLQTNKLRARLEARFGSPTQTLEDLINQENFRPAEAIQFEYWFVVNDSIPLMILDVDGPFGRGLVYGGASRYIDLMPQIKRTLAHKLMEGNDPAEFQDYFYSPEREQWFDVRYENGKYITQEIDSPEGMVIDFGY